MGFLTVCLVLGCFPAIHARLPTLPPHCAAVICPRPTCTDPILPPGECCSICPGQRPSCYGVMCPLIGCQYGVYTPPGRCCPVCRRVRGPDEVDCSAVSCLLPHCSRLFTPPGQCCPVCLGGRGGHLYG